ncbi:MAG: nucleotidyltransferase domain-containing protein [Thermomicrobiales bacterium]|nr:nucleotidyltransferase domain-containing protein [Thermomicrobiales bacterium]
MLHVVQHHWNDIAGICRRYGVQRLELFGSASLALDDAPEPADIDFLAFYDEGYDFGPWMTRVLSLESELSDLLGYPVDIVLEKALENRWFRREAEKTRQVIYDASKITEVA